MKQVTKSELDSILTMIQGKSMSADQANAVSRALKIAFRNHSAEVKSRFFEGQAVIINHLGRRMGGDIIKVAPKNLIIQLDDGRQVKAHPTLCTPANGSDQEERREHRLTRNRR